jgi:hypothetical protein
MPNSLDTPEKAREHAERCRRIAREVAQKGDMRWAAELEKLAEELEQSAAAKEQDDAPAVGQELRQCSSPLSSKAASPPIWR